MLSGRVSLAHSQCHGRPAHLVLGLQACKRVPRIRRAGRSVAAGVDGITVRCIGGAGGGCRFPNEQRLCCDGRVATCGLASCSKQKWCMGSQKIVRVPAGCPAVCDRLLTATSLRLCSLYAPASKTNTSHLSADQRDVYNSAVTASTREPELPCLTPAGRRRHLHTI